MHRSECLHLDFFLDTFGKQDAMFLGGEYLIGKQIALGLCPFTASLCFALRTDINPFIVHPEATF